MLVLFDLQALEEEGENREIGDSQILTKSTFFFLGGGRGVEAEFARSSPARLSAEEGKVKRK